MATIGLIADIHVVPDRQEAVYDMLETVLDELADVDHIVLMGDMVASGSVGTYEEQPDGAEEMMQGVVDRAETADPPVTYLLGNHEVTELSTAEVADIIGQDPFGTFDIAGHTGIVLDTSAPYIHGSRGEVTDEQLALLEETLPDVEDALLFAHHPLHYHNVEDNVWWDVYPERAFCGNKKEIEQILSEHGGVRAVFNAHLHEHDHTVFRGLDHVTVEPFSRKTPDAGPTGAHAVVEIDDDISVTMRDLEREIVSYEF